MKSPKGIAVIGVEFILNIATEIPQRKAHQAERTGNKARDPRVKEEARKGGGCAEGLLRYFLILRPWNLRSEEQNRGPEK